MIRVSRADASFQVWDALRHNRRKRRQRGEFLIHGVRPITAAVDHQWPLRALLVPDGRRRSRWADDLLDAATGVERFALDAELFDRLADRDQPGELIGVGAVTLGSLESIDAAGPVVVLDRPSSPGNVGSLLRSADAFGAAAVVILGHAADPFDPLAVRASMGSLFVVPVVELSGAAALAPWLKASRRRVLGLDESASESLATIANNGPVALVLGNEGRGLAGAARGLCDSLVTIPMQPGAATSLNLAVAGSIALYEVTRDR